MIAEANVRVEEDERTNDQPADRAHRPESKRLGGLVLARQLGESVVIGDSVLVEILGLKTNSVRLRIVAPRSVAVHRREVFDAIRLAHPAETGGSVEDVIADPTTAPLPNEGGLVLTRRAGQTIMIGTDVAVDVVEARTGTVRLRIIAPRSVSVHRREVYDAIRGGQPRGE